MIGTKIDSKQFGMEMNNILNYALGFMDGVKDSKDTLLRIVGQDVIDAMKQYVDSSAKVNPAILHHVYEWHQSGSPGARLFDLAYRVSGRGLSFSYSFRQSQSVKSGSNVPFYNKAKIMEDGIPVTIRPVRAKVLAFEDNGQQVFTKSPVRVENPGGQSQGGLERTLELFVNNYFTQVYLRSSGLAQHLSNPKEFNKNFPMSKRGGRSLGYSTGVSWINKLGGKL
jgi:hypothetical protein